MTPFVSVVMPTYNRRATILRAVRSVVAQTFADWELVVVDDGSTDGTAALLEGIDPRVRVLVRENRGAAAARNTGVAECRGSCISFLDSDDEWLPGFLALTCGFLQRHPEAAWVGTEIREDLSDGTWVRQDHHALTTHYVSLAESLGSSALRLPAGEDDDYLRVYAHREVLGDWASAIALEAGAGGGPVRWYRGRIGEHYRWGYFHALWSLVARADAAREAGPFPEARRSCNDYEFLVRLALRHESHLIAVPCAHKHVVAPVGEEPAFAQLSRGRSYVGFTRNYAAAFHRSFVERRPDDPEVRAIYAFRRLEAGRAALEYGTRAEARENLVAAAPFLRRPAVRILSAIARVAPSDRAASILFRAYRKAAQRIPSLR